MMLFSSILRKCIGGYKFTKSLERINHLMYTANINLFTKNYTELVTIIQTIRIYSQDTGMKFDIEKRTIFIIKGGKYEIMLRIEMPNQ